MEQKEKVEFGLSKPHLGDLTYDEETGYTFGEPKPYLGIQSLTGDVTTEEKEIFAENSVWYVATTDNGYDMTLKMVRVEDDFKINYLGQRRSKEGNLVESADDYKRKKEFYMIFEIDTDKKPNRYILFRCVASKPKIDYAGTESSPDPKSIEIPIKCYPLLGENKLIKGKINPDDANYETAFKTAPVLPTFDGAEE